MKYSTGGLLSNQVVIVCGGWDSINNIILDTCYGIGETGNVSVTTNMLQKRYDMASVVLDGKLWITGGRGYDYARLDSTEWISLDEYGTLNATFGIDLPFPVCSHSMVVINSTCAMLIGGADGSGYVGTTYFVNPHSSVWTKGPNVYPKYSHASAVLFDSETNTKYVIVAGGVVPSNFGNVGQVEVLDLNSPEEWKLVESN